MLKCKEMNIIKMNSVGKDDGKIDNLNIIRGSTIEEGNQLNR